MSPNLVLVFLLLVVTATVGKYVYVTQSMLWPDAQAHCRNGYTDLAPISNEYDNSLLGMLNAPIDSFIWIGLRRDSSNKTRWLWSGGGEVSKSFWQLSEPNGLSEDYGAVLNSKWFDLPNNWKLTFFCYKVYTVREKMTWEEAVQYCRRSHKDLASVASETEMMLMQNELSKDASTDYVWIGLRFLAEGWQWVDGQPYRYEAWDQGGKPVCPTLNDGCGALQVLGRQAYSLFAVWQAHNCAEKLHFLCY